MAAAGRFALQQCEQCAYVHYPPRQVCSNCLNGELRWRDVDNGGELLAETTLHHSNDRFFRDRLPWRLGMVLLDAGPSVVAHLGEGCREGARVRLSLGLDRSGHAVMTASPETQSGQTVASSADDPQLREMCFHPKDRRVLVVDGASEFGFGLVEASLDAGARAVYAGVSSAWKHRQPIERLQALDSVHVLPLDLTDTDSVTELAALIGGKVEILVNNASMLRPGGASGRLDLNTTRDEMDVHYFGLLRLAGAFGPALKARGADGDHGAAAWVNVLSIYALVNNPAFGTYSASQAAALSLAHCLRSELAPGGVRVINALLGPLDDEWHQLVPPPKIEAQVAARRVVDALERGEEDIAVGAVAEEVLARFVANPKEIERAIGL